MAHKSDDEIIEKTHNTARFFTETRHVAWVLLVATILWGAFSYWRMPKRKDPVIPIRFAVATYLWPGAPAEKIEELVTRKMELKIAENAKVERIESANRPPVSDPGCSCNAGGDGDGGAPSLFLLIVASVLQFAACRQNYSWRAFFSRAARPKR